MKDFVVVMNQNSSSKNDLVLDVDEQPQQNFKQCVLDSSFSYHMCPC